MNCPYAAHSSFIESGNPGRSFTLTKQVLTLVNQQL